MFPGLGPELQIISVSFILSRNTETMCVLLQEVEHGGRVEEEDMARLIHQLEGRVGTEVRPEE